MIVELIKETVLNFFYKNQLLHISAYLEVSTTKLINSLDLESKKGGEIQVLSLLTKPLTTKVIQVTVIVFL